MSNESYYTASYYGTDAEREIVNAALREFMESEGIEDLKAGGGDITTEAPEGADYDNIMKCENFLKKLCVERNLLCLFVLKNDCHEADDVDYGMISRDGFECVKIKEILAAIGKSRAADLAAQV